MFWLSPDRDAVHVRGVPIVMRSVGPIGVVAVSGLPQLIDLCFFSSRRRHTIYWRDWSSDVCSSDLLEAVGELAERHRSAGLPVRVEVGGPPRRLPVGVDAAAYRIVQEALLNAARHGSG